MNVYVFYVFQQICLRTTQRHVCSVVPQYWWQTHGVTHDKCTYKPQFRWVHAGTSFDKNNWRYGNKQDYWSKKLDLKGTILHRRNRPDWMWLQCILRLLTITWPITSFSVTNIIKGLTPTSTNKVGLRSVFLVDCIPNVDVGVGSAGLHNPNTEK